MFFQLYSSIPHNKDASLCFGSIPGILGCFRAAWIIFILCCICLVYPRFSTSIFFGLGLLARGRRLHLWNLRNHFGGLWKNMLVRPIWPSTQNWMIHPRFYQLFIWLFCPAPLSAPPWPRSPASWTSPSPAARTNSGTLWSSAPPMKISPWGSLWNLKSTSA